MARLGDPADPLYTRSVAASAVAATGRAVAPIASAVVADTGALAAGDYRVQIALSYADTLVAGKCLIVEHRNAANAATTQVLGGVPAGDSREVVIERYTVAANERIRVINDQVAGAAGSVATATILTTKVT